MRFSQSQHAVRRLRPLRRAIGITVASLLLAGTAVAEPRHGLSIFGDLKYPADFAHFDYVNPSAPKAGRLVTTGTSGATTFDSFNPFILKGDAAHGLNLLFDTLMVRAMDEPDAVYGLVAETADVGPDGNSVTFKLREAAQFSDGTPVTADDVVASFELLKAEGHPSYAMSLRDIASAAAIDQRTVTFTFEGQLTRDLPVIAASLPVLSKAYYDEQAFNETTLTPPLGSGPYKIKASAPGSSVTYERRDDYWAKDLPVNRGRFNFNEIRFDYYRDRNIELENLKSGNFDFREEFTSVNWATSYNIPAVEEGRLIKETLPDQRPSGAQGYFINTRRAQFKDPRVRQALGLAFDFEWSNNKLFYGLYKRTASFFENSDMKAEGPASAAEKALLEPFLGKLPKTILDAPFVPPVTDGSGNNRDNLRAALTLLKSAGWSPGADRLLRNAAGQMLDVEILEFEPSFERVTGPFVANLRKIGVNANLRRVDPAQYQRRLKSFDFDVTTQRYSLRLTPGVELRNFWGSAAATIDGSFNLAGINDPAVDAMIDKIMAANSRDELVTATRAVDRILRASHYWIPHWYKASHSVAYWNKLSRPDIKPAYDPGVLDTWWYDANKAARLASGTPSSPSSATPTSASE